VTACDEPQIITKVPGFDHALKDPVPDAITISSRTKVVIIEGNYTLLNEEPWSNIAELVHDKEVSTTTCNSFCQTHNIKDGSSMFLAKSRDSTCQPDI
jgi:hypothetical protein